MPGGVPSSGAMVRDVGLGGLPVLSFPAIFHFSGSLNGHPTGNFCYGKLCLAVIRHAEYRPDHASTARKKQVAALRVRGPLRLQEEILGDIDDCWVHAVSLDYRYRLFRSECRAATS